MTTLKDPAGGKETIEEPSTLMAWDPKQDMPEDVEPDPLFVALVFRLPKRGSKWPKESRDAWLRMFTVIADAIHPESVQQEQKSEHVSLKISNTEMEASGPANFVSAAVKQTLGHVAQKRTPIENNGGFPIDRWLFAGSKTAATEVLETIRVAGNAGSVWYSRSRGQIRVLAENTTADGADEVLVGIYDENTRPSRIIADVKQIRDEQASDEQE